MITRRTLFAAAAAGALLVVGVTACGDDDGGAGGVVVAKAWARQSPMATTLGAVYMDITSKKADALVKASVPASIAAKVEIHETVATDGGMTSTTMAGGMTSTTMAGGMTGTSMPTQMEMRPVDKLDLPAGQTVSLKPGGYHIMLIDLAAPLTVGQKFDVTLTFGSGAVTTVSVEVREDAP